MSFVLTVGLCFGAIGLVVAWGLVAEALEITKKGRRP